MSMIKGKNTKPEIIVRKYLFHCGFRFRVNVKRLPGTPDIVLRKYKTAIFVNGCFWHGHEGCPEFRPPRTRVEWWTYVESTYHAKFTPAYPLLEEEELPKVAEEEISYESAHHY